MVCANPNLSNLSQGGYAYDALPIIRNMVRVRVRVKYDALPIIRNMVRIRVKYDALPIIWHRGFLR